MNMLQLEKKLLGFQLDVTILKDIDVKSCSIAITSRADCQSILITEDHSMPASRYLKTHLICGKMTACKQLEC